MSGSCWEPAVRPPAHACPCVTHWPLLLRTTAPQVDLLADKLLFEALRYSGCCKLACSEEVPEPLDLGGAWGWGRGTRGLRFAVASGCCGVLVAARTPAAGRRQRPAAASLRSLPLLTPYRRGLLRGL